MGAKKKETSKKASRSVEGQAIFEFILTLPLVITFVLLTYRVNAAMQTSINNQQFARGQVLALANNNANYPLLRFQTTFAATGLNQYYVGVSENIAKGSYVPEAPQQRVSRKKGQGSNESHIEPTTRGDVRVRTSAHLCTQSIVLEGKKPLATLDASGRKLAYNLDEASRFDYCGGELNLP